MFFRVIIALFQVKNRVAICRKTTTLLVRGPAWFCNIVPGTLKIDIIINYETVVPKTHPLFPENGVITSLKAAPEVGTSVQKYKIISGG